MIKAAIARGVPITKPWPNPSLTLWDSFSDPRLWDIASAAKTAETGHGSAQNGDGGNR
jgi:hypothetical protein